MVGEVVEPVYILERSGCAKMVPMISDAGLVLSCGGDTGAETKETNWLCREKGWMESGTVMLRVVVSLMRECGGCSNSVGWR